MIRKHSSKVQILGKIAGFERLENKSEMQKFMYEIVIENIGRNYYVSEKLVDAVLNGAVPIYFGPPGKSERYVFSFE